MTLGPFAAASAETVEQRRPLLVVEKVTKRFSGVQALDDISFEVEAGGILGIIGPNGAGKTTLFDVICGLQPADAGTVVFKGERIERLRPHAIARRGLARTMQVAGVFGELTIAENLRVVATFAGPGHEWRDWADELLTITKLRGREQERARNLSFGQQRLLEFAMAVVSRPALVLLDEPVAGVNPVLVDQITELIQELNRHNITFAIVEHNVPFVAGVSTRLMAMARGRKIAEGTADEVRRNASVLEHYLVGS